MEHTESWSTQYRRPLAGACRRESTGPAGRMGAGTTPAGHTSTPNLTHRYMQRHFCYPRYSFRAVEARRPPDRMLYPSDAGGPMKTVAVIVHWGPHRPTVELARWLDGSPVIAQVAVVANDRSDRPDHLPASVAWILPPRDLGLGGGFRLASHGYPAAQAYLLIGNHVRIPDLALRACLDLLAGTNIGVVAPTLVDNDGRRSGPARLSPVLAAPKARRPPGDRPLEADWVAGTIMFVKADCLRRIPLDGRYYLGFEDVDFCYRVRDAGWSVVVSPHRAQRIGSTTVPRHGDAYYGVRNRLWFARVRGWRARAALIALATAVVVLPRAVALDMLLGHGTRTSALVLHGLLDGLSMLPPPGEARDDEPRAAHWTSWP